MKNNPTGKRHVARRRDPFLSLHGDPFRQHTEVFRTVTSSPTRELVLRGAYVEISLVIVEDGGPQADDDTTAAHRTRMSARLWRSVVADLKRAGLLAETPAGGWTTPLAEAELDRRARRSGERFDGDLRATRPPNKRENSENDCDNNDRCSPFPIPNPIQDSVTSLLPSTPRARDPGAIEVDEAGSVKGLVDKRLGRGGVVSPEARRKVAVQLAIGNADPLVALYEEWPQSRFARNPDGLFIDVAPKLYRDATPEVQQACQPLHGPSPAAVPVPVRASDALVAHIAKNKPR